MKKLTTLLAAIIITMTATSRDFLGVQFGDSRFTAYYTIAASYKIAEKTADHIVAYENIVFAGIRFQIATFDFAPLLYKVSFMLPSKDALEIYHDTCERLDKKYGEGKETTKTEGSFCVWIDGKTEISAYFLPAKNGHEDGFMLRYTDITKSPDDEL